MAAMEYALEPVLGLGLHAHQLLALGTACTQIADLWRHPDAGQQAGRVQLRQREHRLVVGLDLRPCDQRHMRRMDHRDGMNMWNEGIVAGVGVGGHLKHHCILRREMGGDPGSSRRFSTRCGPKTGS